MAKLVRLLLYGFFFFLFTSCDSNQNNQEFQVISLAPSITELIYFIGEEEHLVGNTVYCDYPHEAQTIMKVGDMLNYNYETILSLEPDLVIASFSGNSREGVERIEALGMDTITLFENKVDDIISNILILGEVFDTDVTKEIRQLRIKLSNTMDIASMSPHPGAMVIISIDPLYSITKQTFIGDVLKICGFSNVISSPVAYPMVGTEDLYLMKPDVLIYPSYMTNDISMINDILKKRGTEPNHIPIDQDMISRPGPRIFDLMIELAIQATNSD